MREPMTWLEGESRNVVRTCWAHSFWLIEFSQAILQSQFLLASFTSHKKDGQRNGERNKKWLEGQHNTSLKKEVTTRTRKKEFESQLTYIYNIYMIVKDWWDYHSLHLGFVIVVNIHLGKMVDRALKNELGARKYHNKVMTSCNIKKPSGQG